MYDVVIIGAGPAGLFCAYELITKNDKLKVAILDKGFRVKKRVCPMNKNGVPCQNCNPCAILAGYGGAGTFSDGKLNFIPKLGKSDLTKYMLESEANKLIVEDGEGAVKVVKSIKPAETIEEIKETAKIEAETAEENLTSIDKTFHVFFHVSKENVSVDISENNIELSVI